MVRNSILERLGQGGSISPAIERSHPRRRRYLAPRIIERHPVVLHGVPMGALDTLAGLSYQSLRRNCPIRADSVPGNGSQSSNVRRSSRITQTARNIGTETQHPGRNENQLEEALPPSYESLRDAQSRTEAQRSREVRRVRPRSLMPWHVFADVYLIAPDTSAILNEGEASCAISPSNYDPRAGTFPVRLPCGGEHVICLDCARRWFGGRRARASFAPRETNACPMCRQKLFAHEESRENRRRVQNGSTEANSLNETTDALTNLALHNVLSDIIRDVYDRFLASSGGA